MTEPELHRPTPTDRVTAGGLEIEVVATPAECVAIAARLQIPAVHRLSCRFHLQRRIDGRSGEIVATGRLRATLTRDCVVTLDPFKMKVEQQFRIRFVPAGQESNDENPESDDEIPYDSTALDLGEATVEELALTLDPYPKKPGATLPPEATDEPDGPFAGLARLAKPS